MVLLLVLVEDDEDEDPRFLQPLGFRMYPFPYAKSELIVSVDELVKRRKRVLRFLRLRCSAGAVKKVLKAFPDFLVVG